MNKGNNKKVSRYAANAFFWIIIVAIFGGVWLSQGFFSNGLKEVAISDIISRANKGEISKLEIQGNDVKITKKGEKKATEKSVKESGTIYEQGLEKGKTTVEVMPVDNSSEVMWNLAVIIIPVVAIVAFFMFIMRSANGQNSQAMNFGKSRAKLYGEDKKKIKFEDIAGNENAKQDLYEVVDFLKDPKKYQKMGAKIPSGVLMVGNPGTGKTMLARAVAGEAKVPFFSISGSEFMEMFVGVGASRVRDLFSKAKKNAPAIIFIDEIDAVGRKRGSGMGGGHDEREQTLNQILVEMDGFEKDTGVIVLAATNRADVLDPALLRPGRFDRRVEISLPERKDRLAILEVHFKNKKVDDSVDLNALAKKTAGSAGADLANIANEAAILAARNNREVITNDDLTEAFEKVAIGPERKSKVMSDLERETTAWHEAGHAVVLARAMGGRQAEMLIYGEAGISTGASSDLRNATDIARNMVIEFGMGEDLLDQVFHEENSGMFFDKMTRERPYSEKTAEKIDVEIAKLIKEAVNRAALILKANKKPLKDLTDALLEKETLDEKEVAEILKNAKLPKEVKLHD